MMIKSLTRSRLTKVTLAAGLVTACGMLSLPGLATSTDADQNPPSVEKWARHVWDSAMAGNSSQLEQYFAAVPREKVNAAETLAEYDTLFERRAANRSKAMTARSEAHGEAMTNLKEHLSADDLSQALRYAVEVQTLSPDMSAAISDPEIDQVISWATEQLPQVESDNDWLHAQELLFRLRTLYEDTSFQKEYDEYNEHLEWVNRRVALLARYAPRTLHDLRNQQAVRLGEEPIGEFNASRAIDWRERLDGITATMVRTAMRTAAREHIESDGYQPLIHGGLASLRVFATTRALGETFPTLANADTVAEWTSFIDDRMDQVSSMDVDEVDALTLSRTLDALVTVNEKTIQLPEQVIYREFGEGAMAKLDRFSELIWPDNLRRFRQQIEGNFIGVGILIRENDKNEIMVVNPLEGSPAYFSGVKPNDVIAEVNGESTVGWSLNDAVDQITGKRHTSVILGIKREGADDLIPVEVQRDVIKLRSVKGWEKVDLDDNGDPRWNWYIDPVSNIAYIRLTQFTEDSYADLLQAWREINEQGNPRGLVFDLRYNPGGLLDAAVRISNLFVDGGPIVSGEDKWGRRAWELEAQRNRAMWSDVPTVVLINKGSASASEIVSGALQAHNAAVIVGERSYGKGSVQTVHHVTRDSRLKLTTQYYRLPPSKEDPKGRLVHKKPGAKTWGVDPDIVVEMTPAQVVDSITLQREAEIIPVDENGNLDPNSDERPDINDMLTQGMDPQLEMALLILQAQALGKDQDVRHARLD